MRRTATVLVILCLATCMAWAQDSRTANLLIDSKVMGEQRVAIVYLPASYARGSASYPVLYLTDGDAHIAHTAFTMDFLARNGRMPEMIVVGITNTDRTRDLTPTRAILTRPNGQTQQFPTSGGADRFLRFIETELIPEIESKYRTAPMRVLAGHSFGGLFAIHAMLSKPDLFYGYIAASPSLQWDADVMVKRLETFLRSRPQYRAALYLTLGDEGGQMEAAFHRAEGALKKHAPRDFVWESKLMRDEDHGSVVLPTHYAGFRKLFDGWRMPRDPNGGIAGGLDGAEAHYRKLSQRYGYTINVPENVVNGLGYQLLQAGKLEEAIAIFKRNTELYPRSANVYDSLAEAYEKYNQPELAKANYAKAVELGAEAKDPNLNIYRANLERVSGVTAAAKD